MTPEFRQWPKIPRMRRDATITEKIDGTNACVIVEEDGTLHAQSRKRIITPDADNFGFARWVQEHREQLLELGPGYHYGEWYGLGIQRGYGLDHKRFALFNADRWEDGKHPRPECCDVVPVLWRGNFAETGAIDAVLSQLRLHGSFLPAARGFKPPEGIVFRHNQSRNLYKVLIEGDDVPKGLAA